MNRRGSALGNSREDELTAITLHWDSAGQEQSVREGPLWSDRGSQEELHGGRIAEPSKHLCPEHRPVSSGEVCSIRCPSPSSEATGLKSEEVITALSPGPA